MITIKLPYNSTEDFQIRLRNLRKQFSSAVRFSYNRFIDGKESTEILKFLNTEFKNINDLSGFIKLCAISEAKALYKASDELGKFNIIFGKKCKFIKRCKSKISKEEFKNLRLLPFSIQGDNAKQGNRNFKFDIIENNRIIFKLNRTEHFELKIPKLKKNLEEQIFRIQELNETKQGEHGYTYSIKLTDKFIYISFEEFKEDKILEYNENRYITMDMNPANIGIAVCEYERESKKHIVLFTKEYSLKKIFDIIEKEKNLTSSDRMKYLQNKLKFETLQISKDIAKIAKHYICNCGFAEDLQFKQKLSKTQKYNHTGNRKNRNLWKRELFLNNLKKRLNIFNIKLYEVNPAYSSFIGNLQHAYSDPINASIEIGRRGFEWKINKNKKGFYPSITVKHRWKEMVTDNSTWKELYLETKNSKLKYRVSLEDACQNHLHSVFSFNHKKSLVKYYEFI